MLPATRALISDVAKRHGVTPAEILGHAMPKKLLRARIEIAKALEARGYGPDRIAAVINRDHSSVCYLLGRLKNRKPKLREPTPAKRRRRNKYVGFDPTEVLR